jgi:hypothetical protein
MVDKENIRLFITISQHRMYNHYLPKLLFAIQQLHSEQIWYKGIPHLNIIGGIVLHICEHVKRNSIRFSNQQLTSFSKGIKDYFPSANLSIRELQQVVNDSFNEFNDVMKQLLENLPNKIDMHSLYHLVEHTGYHLGQIVDRAK